jgi:hypothetical protein
MQNLVFDKYVNNVRFRDIPVCGIFEFGGYYFIKLRETVIGNCPDQPSQYNIMSICNKCPVPFDSLHDDAMVRPIGSFRLEKQ